MDQISNTVLIENYICETIINSLTELFKNSKFNPKGGFRQGYGYSFNTYGSLDVIPINAGFMNFTDDGCTGRLIINTSEPGTYYTDRRFNKIIKALHNQIINDILFDFEINCANGHSYWFKFTIQ